jgi:hypothetical protein
LLVTTKSKDLNINIGKGEISIEFGLQDVPTLNKHYDTDDPNNLTDGSVGRPPYLLIREDQKRRYPQLFTLYESLKGYIQPKEDRLSKSKTKESKLGLTIHNILSQGKPFYPEELSAIIKDIEEHGTETILTPRVTEQLLCADYLELIKYLPPELVNALYNNLKAKKKRDYDLLPITTNSTIEPMKRRHTF